MKLQELAAPKNTKQMTKVFESYFGSDLAVDSLNRKQLAHMLSRVRGILREHRSSSARHTSERNPNYLKLVMMEQTLATRLSEMTPPTPPTSTSAGSTQPVDPKLKAAQDKLKNKQTLSKEEQDLINAHAAQVTENRLKRAYRILKEGEVQNAQVVLAAQDMVDKIQGMLEDISELQFKDLPALVESIKNQPQMGADAANQFNTDATAALSGLLQNMQGAKQQLEAALGVVTGQAPAQGMAADLAAAGGDMGAAADDMAAAGAAPAAGEPGGDELDAAAAAAAEPPMGSEQSLGRARR